jgi:hypothetical protein|tara:strand:- start:223 stop:957 length:735 start_codon:yes stop_codon:yes gene_type:complete
MAQPTRAPRPIVSDSVTDTAAQSVLDGLDAGFTIDEIAPDTGPKIRGEARFNQEGLDEIVNLSSKGGPIPGQSLVNDPSQPYPWEQAPEFANPKDALDYMVATIFQPEPMKEIVGALANGAAVADIAMVMLYAKFTEGKFNPDVLMLLAEPVMYVIMAIGEEANIKYNIEDSNDLDNLDKEDDAEEEKEKIKEFKTVFEDIKNGTTKKGIEPSKITSDKIPQNILDKVKEEGPAIRSLLGKGEE